MDKKSTATPARPPSPFPGWIQAFRNDFDFHPLTWLKLLALGVAAFCYKLVTRLPARLARLSAHLWAGVSGRAGQVGRADSSSAGVWWLGMLFKSLDLISFGELADILMLIAKPNTRGLTPLEVQEARRVFGDSLSYWRIRIDEWSLIARVGLWLFHKRGGRAVDMAVTVYSTIHFTRSLVAEPGSHDMAWLIHELAHTAQCEHAGGQFMAEALIAQVREGYDYGGANALTGRAYKDFNREQQGNIAQDYYNHLVGRKEMAKANSQEFDRLIDQIKAGKI